MQFYILSILPIFLLLLLGLLTIGLSKKYKLSRRINTLMANISEIESKFLNALVRDCITYRLSENEALQYIEFRFKKISEASYKLRKAHLLSDKSAQIWLNYFTRIGFVLHHKEQIETTQKIQEDSLRQLSLETGKETRDEVIIKSLKHDIRENVRLLSELGLGTPIIAAIKRRIDDARTKLNPE